MTSRTTNKFSSEVRERAVRLVLDHEGDHSSRWTACQSIATKIGCSAHTYIATWSGFVYVAFVIDVFARRIVG